MRSRGSVRPAQILRLVGDHVLAAQLVLNFRKGVGNLFNAEREKHPAAGGFGVAHQHLVALSVRAGDVGADDVDDDFGA